MYHQFKRAAGRVSAVLPTRSPEEILAAKRALEADLALLNRWNELNNSEKERAVQAANANLAALNTDDNHIMPKPRGRNRASRNQAN